MEELFVIIVQSQLGIYSVLGLAGLIYLALFLRRTGDLRGAFFGLERERARSRLLRSGIMVFLVLIGIVSTFVVVTFAGPAVPITVLTAAVPTVSLLAEAEAEAAPNLEVPGLNPTPMTTTELLDAACQNPDATLTLPEDGDSVAGLIDIEGAADIDGFAFYKIEFKGISNEEVWRAISAGTETVCDEGCQIQYLLGRWDTNLSMPGDYLLKLTVTDTSGNAPQPCIIGIRILPGE
jgi:hypothetical protein